MVLGDPCCNIKPPCVSNDLTMNLTSLLYTYLVMLAKALQPIFISAVLVNVYGNIISLLQCNMAILLLSTTPYFLTEISTWLLDNDGMVNYQNSQMIWGLVSTADILPG